MRLAVGSVILALGILLSHTAAAGTFGEARPVRPAGDGVMLPPAPVTVATTVTVDATTRTPATASTSRGVASSPTAGGDGNVTNGVAVGTTATGTTTAFYEGEGGCDADIFSSGDDDDDQGANVITQPKSGDDDDDTKKSDDDDDNSKKSDDDDDDNSKSSSSSSSSGSTDNSEHTLDTPIMHGTHAQNMSQHHSPSPVSRFALIGVVIAIPLRRRRWTQ